jgi:hypothetical protein
MEEPKENDQKRPTGHEILQKVRELAQTAEEIIGKIAKISAKQMIKDIEEYLKKF